MLAFTGMRPSELMRYRPEHWNRVEHTLTILTGKKGRSRTIPLTEDGKSALTDLSDIDAFGSFSTSTVHRTPMSWSEVACCDWTSKMARPAGFEPAILGLEGPVS